MFTAVLFTRVWTWRQHRYPLADKCIKKSTGVYIERIEYYSAIKKRRFESVLVRQMNLESVIQNEVIQKEKNKYCIVMHIYGIQKNGIIESICRAARDPDIENRFVDTVGEGESGRNGESSTEICTLPYIKQRASGNLLYDTGSSSQCSVII